jgi:hypothetical protein
MAEGLRHDEWRGQERSAGHEQRAIRRRVTAAVVSKRAGKDKQAAQEAGIAVLHAGDSPSLLATRLGGGQGFTLAGGMVRRRHSPLRAY